MLSKVLCICLIFIYQCQSQQIPARQMAHYDSNGNLDFFPAIVGGVPAREGEFPAHISIQTRSGQHICGGTLIDLDYVLTAAHCVTDEFGKKENPSKFQIVGDDLTITRNGSAHRQTKAVIHIIIPAEYDLQTASHDIAILKTEPFTETSTLRPATVALDPVSAGDMCKLAGWGSTKDGSNRPTPQLFKAELSVTDPRQCNASYNGALGNSMFCAKGMGQDSCHGDSGGALHCENNNVVNGIVSFGNGCDNPQYPGVYTDVTKFTDFIDDALRTVVKVTSSPDAGENIQAKDSAAVSTISATMVLAMIIRFFV